MKIIFDLDHTLFKSSIFKDDIFAVFVQSGALLEDVVRTYKIYRDEVGGAYDFVAHADILKKASQEFKREDAVRGWEELLQSDFNQYVDREVFEVMDSLKKAGAKIVLLTKGHPDLQIHKIKKSGLDVFFDEVIICQGSKLPSLVKIQPQAGDWFVNDTWKEVVEVRKEYPNLNYLLLKIDDNWQVQDQAEIDVPMLASTTELLDYIKKP